MDLVSAENIKRLGRQYANWVQSNPIRERIDCTLAVLVLSTVGDNRVVLIYW